MDLAQIHLDARLSLPPDLPRSRSLHSQAGRGVWIAWGGPASLWTLLDTSTLLRQGPGASSAHPSPPAVEHHQPATHQVGHWEQA